MFNFDVCYLSFYGLERVFLMGNVKQNFGSVLNKRPKAKNPIYDMMENLSHIPNSVKSSKPYFIEDVKLFF